MPRNRQQPRYTAEAAQVRSSWLASVDASAEAVQEWDIKAELLAGTVLAVLAAGSGIMFGRSLDGGAVSVTIYDGDQKARKWVGDSIEFEDYLTKVLRGARASRGAVIDAPAAADK